MKDIRISAFPFLNETNSNNYSSFSLSREEVDVLALLQLRYIALVSYDTGKYDWISTLDEKYVKNTKLNEVLVDYNHILEYGSSICQSDSISFLDYLKENSEIIEYLYYISLLSFSHFRDQRRQGIEVAKELQMIGNIKSCILELKKYSKELSEIFQ